MRETERERDPKPREIFALLCFFPWWVGPTENIPDNFASSLRLRLYYIYMSAPPISLHSSRLLQNRSISHHRAIAIFLFYFILMGNANVSHTAFFTNNNINDCFLKKI